MAKVRRNKWMGFLHDHVKPFAFVVLILVTIRSSVADWNDVPTGSMNPSILEGDRIFVNKLAYDLKVPFTTWHIAEWSQPSRGDVVVFYAPTDNTRMVKRVVGVPGDLISLQDNRLFVNGQPAAYGPADPSFAQSMAGRQERGQFSSETVAGRSHPIMELPRRMGMPDFRPYVVPKGHYFMMGDNRDNSHDSRFWGPVERSRIVGRASGVAISLDPEPQLPTALAAVFHVASVMVLRTILITGLVCTLVTVRAHAAPPAPPSSRAPAAKPAAPLTAAALDQSIELGRQYLLGAQRPDGSFIYEVHAEKGVDLGTRHAVRELGGLWALAVAHRHRPTPQTAAAITKALKLQDANAKRTKAGGRYLSEPGAAEWTTNAVALHVLTLLDFLAAGDKIDPALRKKYEKDLADEVKFLLSLRLSGGRFSATYRTLDGKGVATPSPYADGEALLALIRAAKQKGADTAWRDAALESAAVMYGEYVRFALRSDPDSPEAVGFYQWGTMAFYELYTSGWPGTKAYAPRAIAMARWMTDVQPLLKAQVNTGFAFEGVVTAWELARLSNDVTSKLHLAKVIQQGMPKLLSWQIGSRTANEFTVPKTFLKSPKSRGGVLHSPADPRLRIDVTQHQLHATMLARRFMFPLGPAAAATATTKPLKPQEQLATDGARPE